MHSKYFIHLKCYASAEMHILACIIQRAFTFKKLMTKRTRHSTYIHTLSRIPVGHQQQYNLE